MVTDTCRCGAKFQIRCASCKNFRDAVFERECFDAWIEAHAVCRNGANNKPKGGLEAEHKRFKDALIKLRDCDWTIALPDRMDAVRKIAREALGL